MEQHLVVAAIGSDRPGLVNEISRLIYDTGCNMLDSRMTVLGGEFALIVMVQGQWNAVAKLETQLPELERSLDLTIQTKRTTPRASRPNEMPYALEAVSIDHPGIVNQIATFFYKKNVNIEELRSDRYPAPHTGTPMFNVNMVISVPGSVHIGSLREEFMSFCDQYNLDAVLEPVKG